MPYPVRVLLAKPCSERMEKLVSRSSFRCKRHPRTDQTSAGASDVGCGADWPSENFGRTCRSCSRLPTFRRAHRAGIGRENACRMSRSLGFRDFCPGEPTFDPNAVRAAREAVAHLKPAVVVTGGSSGIGLALAKRFIEAGRDVLSSRATPQSSPMRSHSSNRRQASKRCPFFATSPKPMPRTSSRPG